MTTALIEKNSTTKKKRKEKYSLFIRLQGTLLGIEKGLLQSISDDPSAPLAQVKQLLEKYVHSDENERFGNI